MNKYIRAEQIKVGPPGKGDLITLTKFIQYMIDKGIIQEGDFIEYAEAQNLMERMSRNER